MRRIMLAGFAALMLSTTATAQVGGVPVESKPDAATAPGEEQPSVRDSEDRTPPRGEQRRERPNAATPAAPTPTTAAPTPAPSTPPSPDGTTEPPQGAPTTASDAPRKN